MTRLEEKAVEFVRAHPEGVVTDEVRQHLKTLTYRARQLLQAAAKKGYIRKTIELHRQPRLDRSCLVRMARWLP